MLAPGQCIRWFKLPYGPPIDRVAAANAPAEVDTSDFDYALETSLLQFAALMLVQNGVKVNAQTFRLTDADVDSIRRSEAIACNNVGQAAMSLVELYEPLKARLETIAARHWAAEAWEQYGAISQLQDELLEIRRLSLLPSQSSVRTPVSSQPPLVRT